MANTKKIHQRSLKKQRQENLGEDLTADTFLEFAKEFFSANEDQMKEFLSPVRRSDGRYVTSEANLDKFIDLRIFRETQIKRFFRWLSTTPPLFNIFFTWLFITQLGMKLAYFEQQENVGAKDIYKEGEKHAITNKEDEFTIHNLGHATQLIQTSGMNILTDPVFGNLAPVIYPAMTKNLGHNVKAEELPHIDVILISHNHRDHVDVDSLKKLVMHQPRLLVPIGDEDFFKSLGFTNVHGFEWHEQITLTSNSEKTVTFCSVPADHRSGRHGHDSHQSLVMGWTISPEDREEILYFAGDTARINDARMKGLALDIYQLYQHKNLQLETLPRIINLEPGGPNYTRKDMLPTHQSAVDSVVSSFRLALALEEVSRKDPDAKTHPPAVDWLATTATIFMHQNKFELGPDRFNENYFIFTRLCSYLQMSDTQLVKHEKKQEGKSASWSLFHRRKDFIISGVKELKEIAKQIWPADSPKKQQENIVNFIKARTHFPLIREKLTADEPFISIGEQSSIVPDTMDPINGKLKGEKKDSDSPSDNPAFEM
ncbi:MBL fold metallo-hydrolase [Legionella hackeliae]|uniref:Putative hydrolase n=1 Tax=Legionella hackeliae TaxID=449 RepID=A0A0A8UQK5_LEGHA|nr:MBL fold metallo-hydrolase [Legionella hackeliae]KTD09660.1 outer membrane protein RomA [Legionella hackeliae]CEK11023.1 putative hydrolase [Legionella hackeliae]STX47766.1 outer membrane protein RomA [Legionella hackeliae]